MDQTGTWQALLPPLLRQAGLPADGPLEVAPLTGGVSSDIVRVHLADGTDVCAKRALPRLKVAADWRVPTERNQYEVAWFRKANAVVLGSAPAVLAADAASGVALLAYLPPHRYALWKEELLAGRTDPGVARSVAGIVGRIHAATTNDAGTARAFATDALFDALRLDPYLRATAARHPALASRILAVVDLVRGTHLALVHGDLSPKNILVDRESRHPVILDAECAWYGDPAFDAAFCMNHLVLKAIHLPVVRAELLDEARLFFDTWLAALPPAERQEMEHHVAALLPCLMLARVDGKSPVEYLTAPEQITVRAVSVPLIANPRSSVAVVVDAIANHLGASGS
ncbi:MAG TPA: aminoglycoside phosphotransferase family protein [Bauldia sp.]|nr:aminoglycoside phosphotransferase family protein [Bauldia sp.]